MKTVYLSTGEMEDTPAAIDRQSGILYINPKRYFKLTQFQQEYVKWHEYGHYNLKTSDELAADKYAFEHLAGTEFRSLKQCIECLEELLDENEIGHKVRIDYMYQLAMDWDKNNPPTVKSAYFNAFTAKSGRKPVKPVIPDNPTNNDNTLVSKIEDKIQNLEEKINNTNTKEETPHTNTYGAKTLNKNANSYWKYIAGAAAVVLVLIIIIKKIH